MVEIEFYKDSNYEEVKSILLESKMYDKVWETRENLKRKIKMDPESILVAIEDNKIVGCTFLTDGGWNAFIFRVCVSESHRKHGIGSMLLKKAEEIIKKRGIKEVDILVDPKKDHLKSWYSKKNYLDASEWTFMYKKLE
jgi:ribosomal protein S18 acetylase RimI-like enzyme